MHKLVLSTCSEYFMRMFELTPCKHPVVVLQDVKSKEMEALLSYMYAGVVSVAQSDLPQLIKVAEALQIKGLAVPDENLCSNMKYGHTWSPTDDRNSPFPKKIKREENGTQTHRISEPKPGISPQSVTRHSPQGYNAIGSSYGNAMNPQRYSPYSREGEVHSANKGGKKDQIIVPRVTPKMEHKFGNRNNKQTNFKSYPRIDNSYKGMYRPDKARMDEHRDSMSDESHDNRYLDTDDENSSEMQVWMNFSVTLSNIRICKVITSIIVLYIFKESYKETINFERCKFFILIYRKFCL